MKVEIWADVICPWCGLGSRRFERALEAFEHRDQVDLHYRSFLLAPHLPEGTSVPVAEKLAENHGASTEQVEAMTSRVEGLARAEGLTPYHVSDNRSGNTALSHELLAYATEQGRHLEAWRDMFAAYFGERRNIFEQAPLVEFAEDIGLDREGAAEALESRRFRDAVVEDLAEARSLGARGVPFYVIDRAFGVSGAQPTDVLTGVLEEAWEAREAVAG